MTATLSNWRDAGHNVWGFQNVAKIIPTDPVRKSSKTSPLETDTRSLDNFKISTASQKEIDLSAFLSSTDTDGFVLLKDGKIVYEHYDRTNTPESQHALFSISKSVTGLLCGILAQQGKLNVDDLISKHVPELRGSSFEHLTVQSLLDMRSGLDYEEGEPEYRKATGLTSLDPYEKPTNLHQYISAVRAPASAPVEGLNGPPFNYLSINADLIGWVVERAGGQKFAEVLRELIWEPMGAESDAVFIVDRDGNARAAAGLCATVRDVARLGQLLLGSEANAIIPVSWVQDTVNNGSCEAFAAGSEAEGFKGVLSSAAYRNYWYADRDSQTLMASGTNGQMLLIDLNAEIVMAKTSSQPDRTNLDKIRLTLQAFREFERILT